MTDQKKPFWERKTLAQMSREEWESLCDSCGRCCLYKLEDEDTGDIYYTDVACKYMDADTCRCGDYAQRQTLMPECLILSIDEPKYIKMLPNSCAYRQLYDGKPLSEWHPLITGDYNTVQEAGISIRGKFVTDAEVGPDELEDHIIAKLD